MLCPRPRIVPSAETREAPIGTPPSLAPASASSMAALKPGLLDSCIVEEESKSASLAKRASFMPGILSMVETDKKYLSRSDPQKMQGDSKARRLRMFPKTDESRDSDLRC